MEESLRLLCHSRGQLGEGRVLPEVTWGLCGTELLTVPHPQLP